MAGSKEGRVHMSFRLVPGSRFGQRIVRGPDGQTVVVKGHALDNMTYGSAATIFRLLERRDAHYDAKMNTALENHAMEQRAAERAYQD